MHGVDLRQAAAEKIEMVGSGVTSVRVEVLKKIDVMTKPNRKLRHFESLHVSRQTPR